MSTVCERRFRRSPGLKADLGVPAAFLPIYIAVLVLYFVMHGKRAVKIYLIVPAFFFQILSMIITIIAIPIYACNIGGSYTYSSLLITSFWLVFIPTILQYAIIIFGIVGALWRTSVKLIPYIVGGFSLFLFTVIGLALRGLSTAEFSGTSTSSDYLAVPRLGTAYYALIFIAYIVAIVFLVLGLFMLKVSRGSLFITIPLLSIALFGLGLTLLILSAQTLDAYTGSSDGPSYGGVIAANVFSYLFDILVWVSLIFIGASTPFKAIFEGSTVVNEKRDHHSQPAPAYTAAGQQQVPVPYNNTAYQQSPQPIYQNVAPPPIHNQQQYATPQYAASHQYTATPPPPQQQQHAYAAAPVPELSNVQSPSPNSAVVTAPTPRTEEAQLYR